MGKKRRRFSDQFKTKVALEAIGGGKTFTELAAQYKVHPNQVSRWKNNCCRKPRAYFLVRTANRSRPLKS